SPGLPDVTVIPDLVPPPDLLPPPPDLVPPPPVTGMAVDTWVGDTNVVAVANDLSGGINALVPTAGGGFTVHAGTGTINGTFTIPDVPDGYYYVQYGTHWLVTA